jgi:hypothetical protein
MRSVSEPGNKGIHNKRFRVIKHANALFQTVQFEWALAQAEQG